MEHLFTSFEEYPVAFIAEIITLLPLLTGLLFLKYTKNENKLLVAFFFLVFLRDISSNILAYSRTNNLFIYNLFSFVELIFLALLFYTNRRIASTTYRKAIIWGGLLAFLLNCLFYSTTDFSIGNFSTVRVYGLFLILIFFERVLAEMNVKNIVLYSMFWVSSGLLLYFCGTFFIFLLSDKVLSKDARPDIFRQYWYTNLIFYILFCVLASIGIWLSRYDEENRI